MKWICNELSQLDGISSEILKLSKSKKIAFHASMGAGTHNEQSSMLLTQLMAENNILKNDQRVYFSQLLGMSEHISFNLSKHEFNVAKYMPYGPVKDVLPYLIRRAEENTSIAGQTGRELGLIIKEKKRRA